MEKKVEAFIREHHMIDQGTMVIAGVSGGADSVCLLRLLVVFRERMGFHVRAVHVHHGLRGREADRDAQYVRELCQQWEVPCLVVCRNAAAYAKEQGIGVEEAGRLLRYDIFLQEGRKYKDSRIAVAHHQDDQAETILHNLFRGSGLKGLAGMPPVREKMIRPLLCVSRREILDYLKAENISYCQDSTNDSCDYTRNKLRHHVIPLVCGEINSGASKHIVEAGERIFQAEQYIRQEAKKIWRQYGQIQENTGRRMIPIQVLTRLAPILKSYVVMEMAAELTREGKDITSVHVAQILDLAEKGTGRSSDLPYGIRAWKEYDRLCLEKVDVSKNTGSEKSDNLASLFSMERLPADILREKDQKIPENKYTKWFDYDKINGMLSVRTRQTGDYFMLKNGKRKTVKSFMIDVRIPREEREKIPLVAEGSHVLWIVGYRISEFYKITAETKEILQVRMDGGEKHEG